LAELARWVHGHGMPRAPTGDTIPATDTNARCWDGKLTYTGALVSKFANIAITGHLILLTQIADVVIALSVPQSFRIGLRTYDLVLAKHV